MDSLIRLRRDIHAHPELAREERRTTALVASFLADFGLDAKVLPSGTGAIVDIGAGNGPVVGLRADMDALPIQDQKTVPYRSTVEGVSHACGHDVHTAILCGAAVNLAKSDLAKFGRVRCIFQPAEESSTSGSLDMINAGALEDVERIFALHCDPSASVGTIGTRDSAITSAQDHMVVKIHGVGGHSARPHLTPNPILAIGAIVTELSNIVNSRLDEEHRMLIGFGTISSNGVKNAIPSYAEASGTVRIPSAEIWPMVPGLIQDALHEIVTPFALDCDIEYVRVCPAVVNASDTNRIVEESANRVVGQARRYTPPQSFGGEDFAWYLQHTPGSLFRLGVRPVDAETQVDLHSGHFDVDEAAISVGVQMMTDIALRTAASLAAGELVHGASR